MLIGVRVVCRISYSIVSYLYVSISELITSVGGGGGGENYFSAIVITYTSNY